MPSDTEAGDTYVYQKGPAFPTEWLGLEDTYSEDDKDDEEWETPKTKKKIYQKGPAFPTEWLGLEDTYSEDDTDDEEWGTPKTKKKRKTKKKSLGRKKQNTSSTPRPGYNNYSGNKDDDDSGVKQICRKYELVDAVVDYTEEDYQNLNNYEVFQQYIESLLAAENPGVPESHMRMLVEAKWCEFSNRLKRFEDQKNGVNDNGFPKGDVPHVSVKAEPGEDGDLPLVPCQVVLTEDDQNNQNSEGGPDPLAMVQTSMNKTVEPPKPPVQRAPYQRNNNYGRRVGHSGMFMCSRCKTGFINKEKYEDHISKSDCSKPESNNKYVIKKSSSSSVHVCSKCKKGFIGTDVYEEHLKTHQT